LHFFEQSSKVLLFISYYTYTVTTKT